jgi:hypothetical protein
VDIWFYDIAFIIGCNESKDKIARALNMHKESVYVDDLHGFIILNLFQEKYLRGLLDE